MKEQIRNLCNLGKVKEVITLLESFNSRQPEDVQADVTSELELMKKVWKNHETAIHLKSLSQVQVGEIMFNTALNILEKFNISPEEINLSDGQSDSNQPEETEQVKRPFVLSILSVFGGISILFNAVQFMTSEMLNSSWKPTLIILIQNVLILVHIYLLWKMKRSNIGFWIANFLVSLFAMFWLDLYGLVALDPLKLLMLGVYLAYYIVIGFILKTHFRKMT